MTSGPTQNEEVGFYSTLSTETCIFCGKGYATSEAMFTRRHNYWICQKCVRECFLKLAEEKMYATEAAKRTAQARAVL